ncbi:serine/threonine-protein kinase [Legionella busanensis]|uniref:Serine/threonine-protein kinase n=1 Tax=Legionella busanensis TaxID=190655 RepID=A0A378JQF4_9GAMM|nr:protein kinase [Legionella busanensis]STX52150.1 serine/threonine-protein kinase [Legionella busanensis]
MSKLINLKNGQLTPEETQELHKFFESQAKQGIKYWEKNTDYTFNGVVYRFKNDIYQREGKNASISYEVISNKQAIGKGTFGTIKLIKNTVKFSQNNTFFKKTSKKDGSRRVVKLQFHSEKNPISSVIKEYGFSKKADHLAIKKPTIIEEKNCSFTRMKQLKGKELRVILKEDREGIRTLTLTERAQLSVALLKALKEQVIEKNIIHRDIKPSNIMVEFGSPMVVNIIDYGLSIATNQSNNGGAGTPVYSAPEVINNWGKISSKSDIYSMGRILVQLWGGTNDTYRVNNFSYFVSGVAGILEDLFSNIDGLNSIDKNTIYEALECMVQLLEDKRANIDKAVSDFKKIEESLLSLQKISQSKERAQNNNNNSALIILSNDLTKTSLEENHLKKFFSTHKELLMQEKKSGFFKHPTSIKGHESLVKILEHAAAKNNRTRFACVILGWLKEDGSLAANAPLEISEAYSSLNNSNKGVFNFKKFKFNH